MSGLSYWDLSVRVKQYRVHSVSIWEVFQSSGQVNTTTWYTPLQLSSTLTSTFFWCSTPKLQAFSTLAWIVELVLITLNLARLNAPYVLLTLSVLIQLVRTLLAILVPLAMDLYLVVPSAALKGSMYPYLSRQAVSCVQSIPMDHPKEAASSGKTIKNYQHKH